MPPCIDEGRFLGVKVRNTESTSFCPLTQSLAAFVQGQLTLGTRSLGETGSPPKSIIVFSRRGDLGLGIVAHAYKADIAGRGGTRL